MPSDRMAAFQRWQQVVTWWPVVLGDDSGRAWRAYNLTMVEFLLALFTGELPELGFEGARYVLDEIVIA